MGALSEAPHSPQNLAVGALSAPHCEQPRGSTVPHSEQNFLPVVLSVPHFKHRIALPYRDCDRLWNYPLSVDGVGLALKLSVG
jgi:hypothetical protein